MNGAARFLLKLCIFALPLACFFGYVESKLTSVPNGYSVKRELVEQKLSTIQVLITGSSHAFYGIQPALLDASAFSFAYVSQDLFYDTRLVLKYAPRMPRLRLVIMTISDFSLENRLGDTVESWRCGFYFRVFRLSPCDPFRLEDYSLIATYGPTTARTLLFHGFRQLTDANELVRDDGSAPDTLHASSGDLSSAVTLARHYGSMSPRRVPANIVYLRQAVKLLRSRNIAVVFVTTPVFQTYYLQMNPEAYARMQREVTSFAASNGVPYYNYLEDRRFVSSDFFDCDHLDVAGAAKFTRILSAEIPSLGTPSAGAVARISAAH